MIRDAVPLKNGWSNDRGESKEEGQGEVRGIFIFPSTAVSRQISSQHVIVMSICLRSSLSKVNPF